MSAKSSKKEQEKKIWAKFVKAAFHAYTINSDYKWANGGNANDRCGAAVNAADILTQEYMKRYGEDE